MTVNAGLSLSGSSVMGEKPDIVLFTDPGTDVDDTGLLIALARTRPELKLVITSDEFDGGQRARLARHLLDLCGRHDVEVRAGRSLGNTPKWSCDKLVPTSVAAQPPLRVTDVEAICRARTGPVIALCVAPTTDLAWIMQQAPHLAEQLRITLMGGSFGVRLDSGPTWAEHNLQVDPESAIQVARQTWGLQLVTLDVTWDPRIAIAPGDAFHKQLLQSDPAQVLMAHQLVQWERYRPDSKMHDVMAASAALGLPIVRFEQDGLLINEHGQTFRDPQARPALLSVWADHHALMAWLRASLGLPQAALSATGERA